MKTPFPLLLLLASCTFLMTSCIGDRCQEVYEYTAYEPIYIAPEELRQPIQSEPARLLEEPGKIYVYQDYLFINEKDKGIHVYDNSQPEAPQPVRFINIPGNRDMAVQNGILYADNYVDLVAINVSDPANPQHAGRTESVFPHLGESAEQGILVRYEPTGVIEEIPCDKNQAMPLVFDRGQTVLFASGSAQEAVADASGRADNSAGPGQGGSMARFTMAMGHLYVVDDHSLHVFDLSAPTQPQKASTVELGWGIETIFPLEDKLFIGANNGMHIYDNSNPKQPAYQSIFRHATACDPVFVDGDIAYVTLRDGQACQTFTNQLDVVDVSDLTNPWLIKSFEMHNPHGLSKLGDALYICENTQGVKVFDASSAGRVGERLLARMPGFQAYDIITLAGRELALVIGEDGFFQFDISEPKKPELLSEIKAQ
jgi:hypothetical protein